MSGKIWIPIQKLLQLVLKVNFDRYLDIKENNLTVWIFLIPVLTSLGMPTEFLYGSFTEWRRKNSFRTFYILRALRRKEVGGIRTFAGNTLNRPLELLRTIFRYIDYHAVSKLILKKISLLTMLYYYSFVSRCKRDILAMYGRFLNKIFYCAFEYRI